MTGPDPEQRLLAALEAASRGPKRNGIFALWLFTRVATGRLPPDPVSAKAHLRRLDRLQRRLSSLSVPPPLRRALTAAVRQMADGTAEQAAVALQLLVAPSREVIGPDEAGAVAEVAARARGAAVAERGS